MSKKLAVKLGLIVVPILIVLGNNCGDVSLDGALELPIAEEPPPVNDPIPEEKIEIDPQTFCQNNPLCPQGCLTQPTMVLVGAREDGVKYEASDWRIGLREMALPEEETVKYCIPVLESFVGKQYVDESRTPKKIDVYISDVIDQGTCSSVSVEFEQAFAPYAKSRPDKVTNGEFALTNGEGKVGYTNEVTVKTQENVQYGIHILTMRRHTPHAPQPNCELFRVDWGVSYSEYF